MTDKPTRPRTFAEAWKLLPHPKADNALDGITRRISQEFDGILPPNDLGQEFMLWLVEKPGRAADWFYEKDGAWLFGWKSFRRDAAAVMARAARAERHRSGYEPEDDVFYGSRQLEELLPFIYRTTVLATVGGEPEERRAPVDASKGGGHLAAVMDCRLAYDKVVVPGSPWDQVLMALYYTGLNQTEAASALGLTQQVVSRHKTRAFEAILQELNGTMAIVDTHEGPGSRKARSNSASIAMTRSQE